jgi:hypothetical protein
MVMQAISTKELCFLSFVTIDVIVAVPHLLRGDRSDESVQQRSPQVSNAQFSKLRNIGYYRITHKNLTHQGETAAIKSLAKQIVVHPQDDYYSVNWFNVYPGKLVVSNTISYDRRNGIMMHDPWLLAYNAINDEMITATAVDSGLLRDITKFGAKIASDGKSSGWCGTGLAEKHYWENKIAKSWQQSSAKTSNRAPATKMNNRLYRGKNKVS